MGSFDDDFGSNGFLFDGAAFTLINVPRAIDTFASGINNAGQIVGTFSDIFNPFDSAHGFLVTPVP